MDLPNARASVIRVVYAFTLLFIFFINWIFFPSLDEKVYARSTLFFSFIKIPIPSLLCCLRSHLLNHFHLQHLANKVCAREPVIKTSFFFRRDPIWKLSCLHLMLSLAISKTSLKVHVPIISILIPILPALHLISVAPCKSSLKTLQNRLALVRLHPPLLLLTPLPLLFLPPPLPPHLLLPKCAAKTPPAHQVPTQNLTSCTLRS